MIQHRIAVLIARRRPSKRMRSIIKRLRIFAVTGVADFTGEINRQGEAHGIKYDQHSGLGQVPNNEDVQYYGFAVMMRPSQFFQLAAPRDFKQFSSIQHITQHINKGGSIGSPFLDLQLLKDRTLQISGHEGRTRLKAITQIKGDVPVLVHVFFQGKAKNLTPQIIQQFNKTVRPERRTLESGLIKARPLKGPHFSAYYFNGQWHDVAKQAK